MQATRSLPPDPPDAKGIRGSRLRTFTLLLAGALFAALASVFAIGAGASAGSRPRPPQISGPRLSSSPLVTYRFSARARGFLPAQLRFRCAFDVQKLHRCPRVLRARLRIGDHKLRAQTIDPRGRMSRLTRIRITIRRARPSEVISIRTGGAPINTAFGAGSIWVANYGDASVERIDPASNRISARIDLGAAPYGITFGGGAAWVTDSTGGAVLRLDPESNSIAGRVSVGGEPTGLTFGDGAVWVANRDRSVERISPATNSVSARTPIEGRGIAPAVGFGSVWVTCEDGPVFRIDSTTAAVTAGPILVGGDVDEVTVGPDAVWAASLTGQSVARIDPETNQITARVHPGGDASAVLYAGDALWVSLYDRALVQKVDPLTRQVVRTIHVGLRPRGFTFAEGSIWVCNQGSGSIARFPPR